MHRILAATAAIALVSASGAANAADIYSPGYKDAGYYGAPSWTGYYIGAHVGGAWAAADFTDVTIPPPIGFNDDVSGFFGGGQIGYAYQLGNLVIGPEVDIGGIGLSGSVTEAGGLAVGSVSSGFYFDLTGRLGYAWGPALLYAKGGYAYYGGKLSVNDGVDTASHSDLSGWTAGGGVEYKFNPNWSVKAEYQYFEFTTNQLVTPTLENTYDNTFNINTFKVGINYYFCAPYQPLK